MATNAEQPIIIKRKKVVGGDGHHGGAWKVAYADFVTAMMAFFLLMWLLGATSEKQRKGIADYFNPTIPVNRVSGGGSGAFGGDSIFSEDSLANSGQGPNAIENAQAVEVQTQTAEVELLGEASEEAGGDPESEDAVMAALEEELLGRGGESMVSELLSRHVITRVTDQGLIVEIYDLEQSPIFKNDGAEPTETLQAILAQISKVFSVVDNNIAVEGHTRAQPLVRLENDNWDVSVERAALAREYMESREIGPDRLTRVTGHADRRLVATNPLAIRNNRIEVILLRKSL